MSQLSSTTLQHSGFGQSNAQIHFMKNLAILGGLLTVVAHGAGRVALDRA